MKFTMETFGKNLRRLMDLRGINQVELSAASGVNQGTISNYITGSQKGKSPQLNNLIALANALNCTLDELTGIQGMEKAIDNQPKYTDRAIELAKFYESLPDDDQRKQIIEDFLFRRAREKASKEKSNK